MTNERAVDQLMLTEYSAEIMVYLERHKLLPIISRLLVECGLVRPVDPQQWMGENIKRIAANIYEECLAQRYCEKVGPRYFELPRRFLYRVVVFGRPGSGRKTMARYIMKRFQVVLLDANIIINQVAGDTDDMAEALRNAIIRNDLEAKSEYTSKIIARRLLQTDALRRGWVLINYPTNLKELKELMENFKIPPNKFVYLKCPRIMALRRLVNKPNLGNPQDKVDFIVNEMDHYDIDEPAINEYLINRHETIIVDTTPCAEVVKNHVFSQLDSTTYLMGFKNKNHN